MRIVGRTELTTAELPDSLEFSIIRRDGLLEWIAAPSIAALALWMFWRTASGFGRVIAGLATTGMVIGLIATSFRSKKTKLRITAYELSGEGNLGGFSPGYVIIPVSEISEIRFDLGQDSGPSGLYVRRGLSFRCVLPSITDEQTDTIIAAIYRKFPNFPRSSSPIGLLGDGDQLTSLGLSDSYPQDDSKIG